MKTFIYVLDTLADWEIGYLTSELNSRRYFDPSQVIDHELVFIGKDLAPVTTMGGVTITPAQELRELSFGPEDLLVLPGSDRWLEDQHDDVLTTAKHLIENGHKVAAICGATFGLAKIGALDSVAHTSNNREYLQMVCPTYSGSAFFQDTLVAVDGNLITASGIAPLEFAREILALLGVLRPSTLEAWFNLYQTKDPNWFNRLMSSLQ